MNMIDVKKMDVKERLQTMEVLWNSLSGEEPEIESPEWHRNILEERQSKIKSGKAKFISIKELNTKHKS